MPSFEKLSIDDVIKRMAASNATAMLKRHQYPPCEGTFLLRCCTFEQATCRSGCFCRQVGNNGVWVLRPDLSFGAFLQSYANLWVQGLAIFQESVRDARRPGLGRWKTGVFVLREVRDRWPNWDGRGHSLPELANQVRRCYFCDDAFDTISPFIREIRGLCQDTSGVYTSKLISQLFYDIAVPFDSHSRKRQRDFGYDPTCYGGGTMRDEVREWLLTNGLTIADFRRLDDAPVTYWRPGERPDPSLGTSCSRVLDKLFYG